MSDFKLSKHTRSILDNFSHINDAAIFRPGNQITFVSMDKDIAAFAEIEDTIPTRFAIGSVSKLLSVLSLYEDPKLNVTEKYLVIKDGTRRFNFTLAAEKPIKSTEKDLGTFVEQFGDPKAAFVLEAAELKSIKKNMMVAQLPSVTFVAMKEGILVRSTDTTNPTSDNFEMALRAPGQQPDAFNITFADKKIVNMFENTYAVSVFDRIVRFTSDSHVEYFNAPDRGSTVNG